MKNKKSLTILFLTMLVSACTGHPSAALSSSNSSDFFDDRDYYNGYYSSLVSWNNGEDLKNQLHAIIRNGYQPLSYVKSNKQNYDTNIHADHSRTDFEYLNVIYSSTNAYKADTNKGWQREHAWCASLMCGSTTSEAVKQKGRATDFHNLFAANASGNQSRGNKNYGYANKQAETYKADYLTDNGDDGYSYDSSIFEPANIDKGRLARAIFYMATMYKDEEIDTVNNITMKGLTIVENPVSYVAGNNCAFAIGGLSALLEWNKDYVVDYLEMQHNVAVYSDADNPDGFAQGNRNPFVDYPELADYVYGSKKNSPGQLTRVRAAASYRGCAEEGISHYALKEAKREFNFGDTLTANDYTVVSVNKNYSYAPATANITNSFDNHTFIESDAQSPIATITTPTNTISYRISLDPMGVCNSGVLGFTTDGINKKTPNTNQEITIDGVPLYFNFSTTFEDVETTGMTINANNADGGGITIGSTNRVLTKLVVTTKNSYTVDAVYAKAKAGNASSSYSLSIKVGNVTVASGTINDSKDMKVFGGALSDTYTGQISFVFTGSSCLKLNSIAFNEIIA